ncbi:MAG: Dna2/Cas4 domain-containing protein [bacterium]
MEFSEKMREYVGRAIAAIRNIVKTEYMPDRLHSDSRCLNCEYGNFCGDVS